MSLAETIQLWHDGVRAADQKDWRAALEAFTSVQNPSSKLCFNIGSIHLILGNLAEAEQVSKSISIPPAPASSTFKSDLAAHPALPDRLKGPLTSERTDRSRLMMK